MSTIANHLTSLGHKCLIYADDIVVFYLYILFNNIHIPIINLFKHLKRKYDFKPRHEKTNSKRIRSIFHSVYFPNKCTNALIPELWLYKHFIVFFCVLS